MKAMKIGLKHCRKCTNLLMIIMMISFNLIHAEAEVTSFQPGRRLLRSQETSNTIHKVDDTARVDPLNHFRTYTGGFDITNEHYWSSVIFTGIYGYSIALLWFVAGAVYFIYRLSTTFCSTERSKRPKTRLSCHKQCHLFPRILAATFALLAIIASGVALASTMKFRTRANTITSIIIDTANKASSRIHHTTGALKQISQALQSTYTFNILGLTSIASGYLTSTSNQLDPIAADIQREAHTTRRLVNEGLTTLFILTTITISLNLVVIIGVSVFGILRFRKALYMLLILGWLLTTLCCLLFGAYFSLENFASDKCTALREFQHDPNNSSLSSVIPCNELLSERAVLSYASVAIYETINKVNTIIPITGSNSICNPFSGPPNYLYKPGNCPVDSIQIKDIAKVLKALTCDSWMSCNFGQFLSADDYNNIEAFTTSVQSLLDGYPEMQSLADCQLIKNTFSEISVNHCKPLRRYIRATWISILLISVLMIGVELTWISITHHERRHHFTSGSVEPNNTESNTCGSRVAKASGQHQVEPSPR